MDTAWIQIFLLTLSECVAPAGKTVCQQRELELEFLTREHCESALEELVNLKSAAETVIVDAEQSRCVPTARKREVFASADAINAANRDTPGWRPAQAGEPAPLPSRAAHRERLAELETCEATGGVAPCKIGEIIIEGADERRIDVWRRDD